MIENYEALDLGRYMKIDKILRTPAEEIDKQVQIVAILADMTEKDVLLMPLADYTALAMRAAFLGGKCEHKVADGEPVVVGGMRLIPTKDFTKITTAQYVDFQTFAKDFPSTLPELLSCFLVPEGKNYNDGYEVADVQKAVREITLPVALGLTAFFFKQYNASIADSLTSLERMARKNPAMKERARRIRMEAEAALQTIGDGLQM